VSRERRRRLASFGIVAFFVGLATALQLVRQAAVSAWDTIWAEDGSIFLSDALNRSFLGTLAEPYGGYIHVPARLVAALASALPVAHAAFVFSLATSLIVSLVAAFVYFASASVITSASLRVALSGLVVLLPAAGSELLGNVTNLHFHLMFGCFWAFIWRSESTGALVSRSALTVTTALADPLAAIYLPLAFHNAVARRTRVGLVVPIAFICALAAQAVAIVSSGSGPERLTRFDKADVLPLFALRVTGSLLVGALAAVASLLVLGTLHVDRDRRIFVGVCSGYAVLLFSVYLFGRGSAGMRPGSDPATWHLAGARFTLAPILFLSAALLVLADGEVRRPVWRSLRGRVIVLVAVLLISNFSLRSERSLGPRWQPELADAQHRCTLAPLERARVLVAPAPFNFYVSSTCDRIR
jgi:hypothetical protein